MTEEVRNHMRARIEKCRRLAKYINDPRTTEALLAMAAEGEADLAKLEAAEEANNTIAPKMSQGPLA
jgi:hypothetical protein